MLVPSQVILTYVRPSFWLCGLEIAWGVITGLMAMVNHAKQVYALRFFLGLFESSAWPGMMTLLSELCYKFPFLPIIQKVGVSNPPLSALVYA